MKTKNIAIIGAGITGCSLARLLAEQGFSIQVFEQQSFIGGNCYDFLDEHGVLIHQYGPHIFHTDNDEVWAFANRFSSFNNYHNQVLVDVNHQLVKMPINLDSIQTLFPNQYQAFYEEIVALKLLDQSVSIHDLQQHLTNPDSLTIIKTIYELVYANYTAKMWAIKINDIDPAVIRRVKINLNHEWNYFPTDRYQGLPTNGYTKWFKAMLDHASITTTLNHRPNLTKQDNQILVDNQTYDLVIYTGMIDDLFDNCYGQLPYRSLYIEFVNHPKTYFQTVGIINYPAHETLTRICEYKYLTQQVINSTTISYEYPGAYQPGTKWNTPFYPINNAETAKLYQAYCQLSLQYSNLIVAGRLGKYQYFDMDDAIAYCLQLVPTITQRSFHD